jgi:hypothetical protein
VSDELARCVSADGVHLRKRNGTCIVCRVIARERAVAQGLAKIVDRVIAETRCRADYGGCTTPYPCTHCAATAALDAYERTVQG